MTDQKHPHVVAVSQAPARSMEQGTKIGATIKPLAATSGGTLIGCNHVEVPPGRKAFPCHFHCAIEEAIFVLEGVGRVRLGEAEIEVEAGDYITFPPGPETAHHLVNTGDEPLRYLCISSKTTTDVVGYPDSKKVLATGSASLDFFQKPWVRAIFPEGAEVGYFDGEDVG